MWWLLWACVNPGPAPETETESKETETGQDTAVEWLTLDVSCAGTAAGSDPITLEADWDSKVDPGGPEDLTEFIDVLVDDDVIRGVGVGGLYTFSSSAEGLVVTEHYYGWARYHHITRAGDVLVATHRERGLQVLSSFSPEGLVGEFTAEGLEGTAAVGDRLWVVTRGGEIVVLDLGDGDPAEVARVSGLSSPWDLVVTDDQVYVADDDLGVVPVDASDPDLPVIGTPLALEAGCQDVEYADGVLYAAGGSAGVAVVEVSTPDAPSLVEMVEVGSAVQEIGLGDGVLWAVTQRDVAALDVSSPSGPVLLGVEETDEFSMAVAAVGQEAFVGDWGHMLRFAADPGASAPSLRVSPGEVLMDSAGDEVELTVSNFGNASLTLQGAQLDDERLSVLASGATIEPGSSATLRIAYSGGDELDASLCLASDDPDGAVVLDVYTFAGADNPMLGQSAPDFALEDLDGTTHVLSEQLGGPVLLAYFATW